MRTNKEHRVNGGAYGPEEGEPTAAGIDRGWPHQVVVPATECTGSHGRFMEAFCLDLCVREASQRLSRGQVVIVYCFADPEHAKKFRVRFAANGSIRKIEAAAPAGRGGTRMDAERLLSFDADASAAQLPRPEALRMEAARLIKSKIPHSMVEVKTCRVETLPRWLLGRGERFRSGLMSITKEWARADYF